jgi:hypothetical protein
MPKTYFHEEMPSMKKWTFTKIQTKDLVHIPVLHMRNTKDQKN